MPISPHFGMIHCTNIPQAVFKNIKGSDKTHMFYRDVADVVKQEERNHPEFKNSTYAACFNAKNPNMVFLPIDYSECTIIDEHTGMTIEEEAPETIPLFIFTAEDAERVENKGYDRRVENAWVNPYTGPQSFQSAMLDAGSQLLDVFQSSKPRLAVNIFSLPADLLDRYA